MLMKCKPFPGWLMNIHATGVCVCFTYVFFPFLVRFAFSTTSCKAFAHNLPWRGAILSGKRLFTHMGTRHFLARAAAKWTQSSHHYRLFVYFFLSLLPY